MTVGGFGSYTATAFACLILLTGCGSGGPTRYPVSGKVTFKGEPIPQGFITFEPDADQGNSGPGGGAQIDQGVYSTGVEKGVVGGAYTVKIVGYDGKVITMEGEELKEGTPLFPPYYTSVDFPQSESTKDFDVPADVQAEAE